jgi:hypothetical protein
MLIILSVVMLNGHYAECRYAECRYAECRYAECHYAECCSTFMMAKPTPNFVFEMIQSLAEKKTLKFL